MHELIFLVTNILGYWCLKRFLLLAQNIDASIAPSYPLKILTGRTRYKLLNHHDRRNIMVALKNIVFAILFMLAFSSDIPSILISQTSIFFFGFWLFCWFLLDFSVIDFSGFGSAHCTDSTGTDVVSCIVFCTDLDSMSVASCLSLECTWTVHLVLLFSSNIKREPIWLSI